MKRDLLVILISLIRDYLTVYGLVGFMGWYGQGLTLGLFVAWEVASFIVEWRKPSR